MKYTVTAIIVGLLFIAPNVQAHESPPQEESRPTDSVTLSLQDMIKRSLAHNPAIKEIDYELAKKLADAFETEVLENPEATADSKYEDGKGSPAWEVEIEQPIKFSHFGARQSYATALENVANLEQKASLLIVMNDTVRMYYDYWLLQERENYLRDAERQVRGISHQVGHAADSGEIATTESNIFGAEALRLSEELRSVKTERQQLLPGLLRATGMEWTELSLTNPTLSPIPKDIDALLAFAETRSSIKSILLARKKAAEARYKVARQDSYFPEIAPRFLYDRERGGTSKNLGVGITLSIPLWNRNQGEVSKAKSKLAFARTELDVLDRLNINRIIGTLQAQAISAQQRAESYRNKIFPAYKGSYALTLRQFEAGQASMLQLWEVREMINEIQEKTLETAREALEARLQLEEALGGKLEEIK